MKSMKNRKQVTAIMALVLAGVALCIYSFRFFTNLGTFIFSFSLALSLTLFLLLFFRETVFTAWKKFAKWYIPIAAILIFLTAGTFTGGSWGPSTDLDAEGMSILASVLFFFISLIVIGWKSWKLRMGKLSSR